ncbi:putative amidohydrolase YtcJ [Nematostella vectensis]|uniref:putative amidohydrolase YtcJ n=1 Tax=Nematostella vectensis TaxID=45351 RepID=UPI00207770C1|nr:putative amidohydrolase YtcJ [Nematostella vectensis]
MSQKEFADTIFTGGNIFTMDDAKPKCEAVAVKGDTILAVGRKDDVFKFSGPSTTVIDLEGKTMFPGFIEPHQHAIQAAIFSILPSISGYECFSYAEVKARIMKGISAVDPSQSPLGWGVTFGWDPELVRDLPALDAKFIAKEFSADIPVLIVAQNGHAAWCNHKAFEVAGIDSSVQDSSDAVYGREEDGSLSGEVWESGAILGLLSKMPKSPDADPKKLLTDQWKAYASYGFTTVTELAYTPNPPVDEIVVKMAQNKDCPIRLGLYQLVGEISDVGTTKPIAEPTEMLWEAGIKLVADGSPHCGTAGIVDPYLDSEMTKILSFPPPPSNGLVLHTPENLYKIVRYYHEKNMQVATHAHGDRTCKEVVDAYEKVMNDCKTPTDVRHRIEHCGLMTPEQIARAAKLNIAMSFFVDHLYFYATSYTNDILGPERTNRWTPLSVATEYGAKWTIHQDHPTYPGHARPFANIKTAVTRTQRDDPKTVYGEEYKATLDEALKAYTINAAWQLRKEKELGSLEVGKKADLLIISDNPHQMDAFKLEEIKVVDTFLGGRSTNQTAMTEKNKQGKQVKVYA